MSSHSAYQHVALDETGSFYRLNAYTSAWEVVARVPGRPTAMQITPGNEIVVATESGDIFFSPSISDGAGLVSPSFSLAGNPFSGATITVQETWGQVKDRYRK